MVTIVIPSRNEPYLQKTIQDLILKAKGEIEIIAVLDGYWPQIHEFVNDPRVTYIHYSTPRGMRNAINSAVRIAKGKYILKCDAHVMFDTGYDVALQEFCENNWIVVPRRYALDPEKWERTNNPKYPVDYMYLSKDFHGVVWDEMNKDEAAKGLVWDELMSSQGSCWFMHKQYYKELDLMDEEHFGSFASEFQEVGLKCWLSGGKVIVNKKTWYAHWHKTETRGYSLDRGEGQKAQAFVEFWMSGGFKFPFQKYDLKWLLGKFRPAPTWTK